MKQKKTMLTRISYTLLSFIFVPFFLNAQSITRVPAGTTIHTTINSIESSGNTIREGELKKTTKVRVIFKNDKIVIKPLGETINVVFPPSADIETLNVTNDSEIYLDMSNATPFTFSEVSLDISLISIPLIFRPAESSNEISTGQWGLRNAGLMIGANTKFYKYNGVLKNNSISVGAYVAPTIITLTPYNSSAVDEINKVGLNTGVAMTFSEKRFNVGVTIGTELISEEESLDWVYRNQINFGFLVGFRIN